LRPYGEMDYARKLVEFVSTGAFSRSAQLVSTADAELVLSLQLGRLDGRIGERKAYQTFLLIWPRIFLA